MRNYTFRLTLLGAVIVTAIALFIPGREPPEKVWLPWQIEPVDGSIRVFGLTLGRSTLAEAETRFGEESVLSLFADADDAYQVEAYFDNVELSGIRAKIVAEITVPAAIAEQMYRRGTRISTLGSGTRKVNLHPDDQALVRSSAIATLTYLPRANLDEAVLTKRFGEPAERLVEDDGVVHLLYPAKGLDIAVSDEEKEVLLYVPPSEFGKAVGPLRESAASR